MYPEIMRSLICKSTQYLVTFKRAHLLCTTATNMSNLVNIELVIVISESDVYNFVKSCSQSDAYAQVLIQSTAGTANRRQNRKENKH